MTGQSVRDNRQHQSRPVRPTVPGRLEASGGQSRTLFYKAHLFFPFYFIFLHTFIMLVVFFFCNSLAIYLTFEHTLITFCFDNISNIHRCYILLFIWLVYRCSRLYLIERDRYSSIVINKLQDKLDNDDSNRIIFS